MEQISSIEADPTTSCGSTALLIVDENKLKCKVKIKIKKKEKVENADKSNR